MKKILIIIIIVFCLFIGGCTNINKQPPNHDGGVANSGGGGESNEFYISPGEFRIGYQKMGNAEQWFILSAFTQFNQVCDNPYEVSFETDDGGFILFDCFLIRSLDELWKVFKSDGPFLSKYDESYFDRNALIFCFFSTGTSDAQFLVTDVKNENSELIINSLIKEGFMESSAYCFTILEVNKNDCDGVRKIKMNVEEDNIWDTYLDFEIGFKNLDISTDYLETNYAIFDKTYNISFDGFYYCTLLDNYNYIIVNSLEQLEKLTDDIGVLLKYGETFFEEKSLIICYFKMNEKLEDIDIWSLRIHDNYLKIYIGYYCTDINKPLENCERNGLIIIEVAYNGCEKINSIIAELSRGTKK
ncbi:MAG: hypothetical protein J6X93_01355 [Bacilli bacterium]|nr:hypothetical protein [Bacilli bacterium]